MDFEEQLEKAERLDSPSLVGSSLRSADDSPHNNYIHPEKYKAAKKGKPKTGNSSLSHLTASLDDLMTEGALLGSEEGFENYLDDQGNVKKNAIYQQKQDAKKRKEESKLFESKGKYTSSSDIDAAKIPTDNLASARKDFSDDESEEEMDSGEIGSRRHKSPSQKKDSAPAAKNSIYGHSDFSTPNLSEYQLAHDIKDHNDFLNNVQTRDPHLLPKSTERERITKKDSFPTKPLPTFAVPDGRESGGSGLNFAESMHTPYFHTEPQEESRSRSRSRSAVSSHADRSRSSSARPHLARGDSYKNTNIDEPSKYELPPEFAASTQDLKEEDEDNDRLPRQARPTMGESIAAAERERSESVTTDPSLVTTGDYTNFDVDRPKPSYDPINCSSRSQSSTNYLRSISRSRSRQPEPREDEKNDADTTELAKEGALLTDDPYSGIDRLDTMVEEVLHLKEGDSEENHNSDKSKNPKKVDEKDSHQVKNSEEPTDALKNVEIPVSDVPIEISKNLVSAGPEELADLTANTSDLKTVKEDEEENYSNPKSFNHEVLKGKAHNEYENANDTNVPEKELNNLGFLDSEEKPARDVSKEHHSFLESNDIEKDGDIADGLPPLADIHSERNVKNLSDHDTPEDEKIETLKKEDLPLDSRENENASKSIANVDNESNQVTPTINHDESNAETNEEQGNAENYSSATLASEDKQSEENELENLKQDHESVQSEVSKTEDSQDIERRDDLAEADQYHKKDKSETIEEDGGVISKEEKLSDTINESKSKSDITTLETAPKDRSKSMEDEDDLDAIDVSPEDIRKHLESQPVFIYTSLAGGMQIMNKTNRLTTILNANGIKFSYRDLGTDEEAKKIWRRQNNGKTLPGVVRGDDLIGNWQEIDEANEEYKLQELIYETL
ncbi:uncharacterized protein PRCAT00000096001 [Priceomyces carsonii]|uniref:uncharacterized protein n=1 Tax=Priceomyces carsonii TaxID=28549 RepID=UPI002ED9B6F6|nr:unnamed protein product [Priceomyces carsonii]